MIVFSSLWRKKKKKKNSIMSPSMCCTEWCLARSQTGSICRNTRQVPQRTHFFPSCCAQVSESVLVGLARELDISVACERAAALRVRQMFSGQSRRDHTHLVRWPQFSSSEPSRTDFVEQWRQHFVSGSQSSGVFDENIHGEVTRRFSALFVGPFDGPFSVAELVGALSKCAESAEVMGCPTRSSRLPCLGGGQR